MFISALERILRNFAKCGVFLAQANIVALLDNTGATVVKYKYDAWGKCITLDANGVKITDDTHIGILNPFRYRSYYYDTSIELYFLKTRYYDPEIGRFMTIDDIRYLDPESINGLNLYAYCLDNPVMYSDPSGTSITLGALILIGAVIGLVSGAAFGALDYAVRTENFSWRGFWASVAGGAVSGLIAGAFSAFTGPLSTVAMGAIGGAVGGLVGSLVESAILGNDMRSSETWGSAFYDAAWGAAGGALGALIAGPSGSSSGAILAKFLKHPIKNFLSDLIEQLLMDFTTWYSQTVIDGTIKNIS